MQSIKVSASISQTAQYDSATKNSVVGCLRNCASLQSQLDWFCFQNIKQ
jgi:hypothetical protein